MTTTKWIFSIEDKPHKVVLKFGLIPGRQIWLDGILINKGRRLFETGSEYPFAIDSHNAELGIISTSTGYEYYLRVDDQFVFPGNSKNQKIGKRTEAKFKVKQAWLDFGKRFGLEYFPVSSRPFMLQHRLVGYIEDFLITIGIGSKQVGDNSVPVIYLLLRHSSLDEDKIKEIKNNREILESLKKSNIRADWLEVHSGFTILSVSPGLKKIGDFVLVERLLSIIPILSKYIKPSMADRCEGAECKLPYHNDLKLIFFNDIPGVMCQDCIDNVDKIGQKAQEEYKKSPNNLAKGVLYGLAAALLGAIGWALVIIFMDTIGAVVAVLILLLVVKAMDYARTKRTIISLLLAGLLSMIGAILGSYFGMVGYLIKEKGEVLNLDLLTWLARRMIEEPKLISETILFSLIGLVPYLYLTWNATRHGLNRIFKPEIEVIPSFKLH
ncbi:MAG: hypothetical protein HY869_08305 [Chloroflexi bacterium]|nr:hypothetical protein [Chloroflexota bacterium]